MRARIRTWVTYPNVVASIALFAVLAGGGAYAASKIGPKDIGKNAVRAKHVKKNQIASKHIKRNAIKRKQLSPSALGLGLRRVAPSASNNDEDVARAAATRIPLLTAGPLRIYAKCFGRPGGGMTNPGTMGEIFVETTQNGSIMSGDEDHLEANSAGDFLNANTPEEDRQIITSTSISATGVANMPDAPDSTGFMVATPDGTSLSGMLIVATKVGTIADPTAGEGIYRAGSRCLFSGFVTGG